MNTTPNELTWKAIDQLKQAADLLSEARTNLVLAGHGEKSVKWQKKLARIQGEVVNTKVSAAKTVGVRRATNDASEFLSVVQN